MSEFDPDEIIQEVLAGNKDRFRLLVREYGLLVRGFLSARLYHLEDAEDLAQEAFLTAYAKLSTYEIGTNFRAWLLTIAKFQLSNHWRKSSRRANAMDKFFMMRFDLFFSPCIYAGQGVPDDEVDK